MAVENNNTIHITVAENRSVTFAYDAGSGGWYVSSAAPNPGTITVTGGGQHDALRFNGHAIAAARGSKQHPRNDSESQCGRQNITGDARGLRASLLLRLRTEGQPFSFDRPSDIERYVRFARARCKFVD
jgi:hypothetical protein